MTGDREPLTPEERDLAERLARSAPHAGPSPALDARVLAAARAARPAAAGGAGGAGSGRPRRHWPAALGVAASLALAVGIAWQLRPQPEPFPAESSRGEIASIPRDDPARAQAATPPLETDAPDPQEPPPPAARAAPTDTIAAPPDAPAATQARADEDDRKAMQARGEALRRQESRRREIAPAPVPVPVPAPPPPAPPAPAIDTGVAAEAARTRSAPASATDTAIGRERVRGSAVTADSVGDERDPAELGVLESPPIEERAFHDQPLDDEPPATADSPRVHRAWLARIRELRDEGELEAARESLREFHRRHPEVELPDDLAGLLDE